MGFLIKVGFWLGLVLVLLPRPEGHSQQTADTVGPLQVLHTATQVASDFAGICDRKPDVCKSAGEIVHTIAIRAREGAVIAYETLANASGEPDDADLKTGSIVKDASGSTDKD